jgi:hypothetical protein
MPIPWSWNSQRNFEFYEFSRRKEECAARRVGKASFYNTYFWVDQEDDI